VRCARCHRQINHASVTAGGMVFGPTCGLIMGLMPAVQPASKTRHRAVKAMKGQLSTIICKKIFVQDGQIEMFERMT